MTHDRRGSTAWSSARARRSRGARRAGASSRASATLLVGARPRCRSSPSRAPPTRTPAAGRRRARRRVGDPKHCSYWRHCAIDGFLCACCGGTQNAARRGRRCRPSPGSAPAAIPATGKDYIISYNDCCGQSLCVRCRCTRTEGEQPVYHTSQNNDLLWCFGTKSRAVHCSVAVVLGVATQVVAACARRSLLALLAAAAALAPIPGVDYALNCQGCHRADGGDAGQRAAARGQRRRASCASRVAASTSCRCPGVAQAPLDDAALAAVLNWMLGASTRRSCRRGSCPTRRPRWPPCGARRSSTRSRYDGSCSRRFRRRSAPSPVGAMTRLHGGHRFV